MILYMFALLVLSSRTFRFSMVVLLLIYGRRGLAVLDGVE